MGTFFGISTQAYARFARAAAPLLLVLSFFFISGACGLVYQVVWTRKLVLLFGTTAFAISTVLSVFFLGLGIGSLWGGRLADRLKQPLLAYAILEIAIGIWAAIFILGIDSGESAIAYVLRVFGTSRVAGILVRAALAMLFILLPVILMGATLPLLSKFLAKSDATRGFRISILYVMNTIGAVTGCLFAGVYGIEMLGYKMTTFVAAAGNIGVGILALLAMRWLPPQETASEIQHNSEQLVASRMSLVTVVFAISGFCTLALEVLWTRLLTLVFMGTTYAYTVMLTAILAGIALGSLIAGVLADRTKSPALWFGLVECAAGIACFASLILIAQLPETMAALQHRFSFSFQGRMIVQFLSAFTVLIFPTILFGMTFPFAVRAATQSHARLGADVGLLYGVNTFGGVVGAIVGGYLLLPVVGAHNGVLALGAILLIAGGLLMVRGTTSTSARAFAVVGVSLAIAYVVPKLPDDASHALNQKYISKDEQIIAYREGVEGTVVVSEPANNPGTSNRTLWINGVQATQSVQKGVWMNRFQGVLPFVFDRDPRNALLICFGSGITAGTLASSNLEVTGVELSHDVLAFANLFETDNWNALANPRLKMLVDDGRNFLLTKSGQYDIITFEPMPIAVSGVATFYSREFYELCKSRLAPRGIVVQWMPLHGTDIHVIRTLLRTFHDIFPECSVWFVNSDLFVVGSSEPLQVSYANAERRMSEPRIAAGLREAGINDVTELLSRHFMTTRGVVAASQDGSVMRDDRPWIEFAVPRILHTNVVGASIEALLPHFEPLPTSGAFDGVPEDTAVHVKAGLEKRYRARLHTFAGIQKAYAIGPLGNPEKDFEEALRIDPEDAMARAYFLELAPQRMAIMLRTEEFEEAEAYLTTLETLFPGSPQVLAMKAQLERALAAPTDSN